MAAEQVRRWTLSMLKRTMPDYCGRSRSVEKLDVRGPALALGEEEPVLSVSDLQREARALIAEDYGDEFGGSDYNDGARGGIRRLLSRLDLDGEGNARA